MAINDQIGGSQEAKLLNLISKQLERLNGVASKASSGGGGGGGAGEPLPVWTEDYWQEVYNEYQRPSDWLELPTVVDGEQKAVMLHQVINADSNFCAFTCLGNYTVDWGDGTTPEDFVSGTIALHMFDYNAPGIASQTPTSMGYRQCIVTVTPQAGQNLTKLDLNIKYSPTSTGVALQTYSTGWLDVRVAGQYFTRIAVGSDASTGGALNVYQRNLQIFEFVGTANIGFNNTNYMFYKCESLVKIVSIDMSNVTITSSMFDGCYSLITVPLFNLIKATNTSLMFNNCNSLRTVPLLDLRVVTNASSMFANCRSLYAVPLFEFNALTNGSGLFSYCSKLKTIPLFNFSLLTNPSSMFNSCVSLVSVPLFDLSKSLDGSLMFYGCFSMTEFPLFDLSVMTTGYRMFSECRTLRTVPLFNLSVMTNGTEMFYNCQALSKVPLFNLSSLTNGSYMFASNFSLVEVPLFNLSKMTNGLLMFNNCYSLVEVPLFDLSKMTNGSGMFSSCYSVIEFPLFDLSKMTDGSTMFTLCRSITTIPLFNLGAMTIGSSMFADCYALCYIPLFNLSLLTDGGSMFSGCSSISKFPAFNLNALTNGFNMFPSCISNQDLLAINIKTTITMSNNMLSRLSLENLFRRLSSNVSSKTITISGNWGADASLSKTGAGTATGSTTVTLVNTTGLLVGMLVSGVNITTPRAVTFQDIGDTVTLVNHGFSNGTLVSFTSLVTTTGIALRTVYYVVNATTDTFQLSLTNGGAPLVLTNNGTGTVLFPTYITSINPGVNITIDRVASGTGTVSLTLRILDTSIATLKGWTVGG